jgi:vacuolar-type H+-ATPase subunit I/STV1
MNPQQINNNDIAQQRLHELGVPYDSDDDDNTQLMSRSEMCEEIKSLKEEGINKDADIEQLEEKVEGLQNSETELGEKVEKAGVVLDQSYEVNAKCQKTIEDLTKKVKNHEINEKLREEKLQEVTLENKIVEEIKVLMDVDDDRDFVRLIQNRENQLDELIEENKKVPKYKLETEKAKANYAVLAMKTKDDMDKLDFLPPIMDEYHWDKEEKIWVSENDEDFDEALLD